MVAESGAALLEPEACKLLVAELLPKATVVTPNLDEARVLIETAGGDPNVSVEELSRSIHALGPRYVVVTGGHSADEPSDVVTDVFFDGERVVEIPGRRFAAGASHGSGCTHSSVLAAQLALGRAPLDAAREAKKIASEAVRDGLRDIGSGSGPVDALGILGAPDRSG
jgi:hydroxymethylpyrimidine/phosphomethylpyrimidine kinase